MNISNFDDLLRAARSQPQPQRLLFVFANAELPDDCTPEQRTQFQQGQGGTLNPSMSVDKAPQELDTFATLVDESRAFAQDWVVVFAAGLSGRDGQAPTSEEADQALLHMIESVKTGAFGSFMPFDRHGEPIVFG